MKTKSLWIIRVALAVQFVCVLAVPVAVASSEAPRALWMAEWIRAELNSARTIGVLTLRDGKLSFKESAGQAEWTVDVTSIARVEPANGGKALAIVMDTDERYVVAVMEPNLEIASPKKLAAALERAIQFLVANKR